jgi:hypothetical protein
MLTYTHETPTPNQPIPNAKPSTAALLADVVRVLSAKSAANANTCSHGRFHGANEHAWTAPASNA